MAYGWKITKVYDDVGLDEEKGKPIHGPRDIPDGILQRLNDGEGVKFKMGDDDGHTYYKGRIIGGDGFEPLDDFGMPNAGCVWIKYQDKKTKKWEIL